MVKKSERFTDAANIIKYGGLDNKEKLVQGVELTRALCEGPSQELLDEYKKLIDKMQIFKDKEDLEASQDAIEADLIEANEKGAKFIIGAAYQSNADDLFRKKDAIEKFSALWSNSNRLQEREANLRDDIEKER